jgi:hypothetical protein
MIASLVQVADRMNALNWKQAWGDRAALMQKHTDLCAKFDGQHGHIKLVHAGRLYQHAQRAGTAYQRGEKRRQGLEFVEMTPVSRCCSCSQAKACCPAPISSASKVGWVDDGMMA